MVRFGVIKKMADFLLSKRIIMAIVLLLLLAFSYIGFFYTSCNVHCINVRLIKYFAVFDIFCHRSTSRLGN